MAKETRSCECGNVCIEPHERICWMCKRGAPTERRVLVPLSVYGDLEQIISNAQSTLSRAKEVLKALGPVKYVKTNRRK